MPDPSSAASNSAALSTAAISAQNLSKTYRLGEAEITALADVSLTVEAGEFVAVMGPSGSGKSTLLYMLGLLDLPDSGKVLIEGRDTTGLDDDELTALRRDRLGFLFQSFELIPNLSARENVLLPAEIAGRTAAAAPVLADLAARLGISDRLDHRPRQLSGGQRQRVALARALINSPALLLCDEPTGNLDTRTGNEVLSLLREGVDRSGWTIVMVTHDPAAALNSDRVVFLRDGRVAGETRAKSPDARADIDRFLSV